MLVSTQTIHVVAAASTRPCFGYHTGELHRHETNEIVVPLYASTVQLAALAEDAADAGRRIEGGAFLVNSGGLGHYERYGW